MRLIEKEVDHRSLFSTQKTLLLLVTHLLSVFCITNSISDELVQDCVDMASKDDGVLTLKDVAACNRARILDTRRTNPTAYEVRRLLHSLAHTSYD